MRGEGGEPPGLWRRAGEAAEHGNFEGTDGGDVSRGDAELRGECAIEHDPLPFLETCPGVGGSGFYRAVEGIFGIGGADIDEPGAALLAELDHGAEADFEGAVGEKIVDEGGGGGIEIGRIGGMVFEERTAGA